MSLAVDLLVVGAGPAGMAAAVTARRWGLTVACVDEQPAPGGQIWRGVETVAVTDRGRILGDAYREGISRVAAFRASGAVYLPGAQVWQIEPGFEASASCTGQSTTFKARRVLLATGAQERPAPFTGWTLPGVLTVGAGQILLKTSGEIPAQPVWIVGCGPLPLLYASQLLKSGGSIAGWLDTVPRGQHVKALKHAAGLASDPRGVLKGLGWMRELRRAGVSVVRHVTRVEASGNGRVEHLNWRTATGVTGSAATGVVLVHEGVIPGIHAPLSLGCEVRWDDAQACFTPVLDDWGETSRPGLFVAGDGAGIAGADAAVLRGELAGLAVAFQLGALSAAAAGAIARPIRRKLGRALAIRPLLDALYRPRREIFEPADEAIVCRCEELTAAQVRASAGSASIGLRQFKAMSRAGMGPCQGRQCGPTINRLLAAAQGRSPAQVGPLSVRPPLKPVTLGELAAFSRSDL